MFKAILISSVLALTLASAASARTACQETADTNYAIAVAIDYTDADMVHENSLADCESDEYMSDTEFRVFMLNKIAKSGTSEENKRYQVEAFEFTSRCPNGHYDYANDVDVCGESL